MSSTANGSIPASKVVIAVPIDNVTTNLSETMKEYVLPTKDKDGQVLLVPCYIVDPVTGKAFGSANPLPVTIG